MPIMFFLSKGDVGEKRREEGGVFKSPKRLVYPMIVNTMYNV